MAGAYRKGMDNEIKRVETIVTRTSGHGGFPSTTTHRKVRFVYQGVEYLTKATAETVRRADEVTQDTLEYEAKPW